MLVSFLWIAVFKFPSKISIEIIFNQSIIFNRLNCNLKRLCGHYIFIYFKNRFAIDFVDYFTGDDVTCLNIPCESPFNWDVSSNTIEAIKKNLLKANQTTISTSHTLKRFFTQLIIITNKSIIFNLTPLVLKLFLWLNKMFPN